MIDLDQLCEKRPFLYHLTNRENVPSIVRERVMWSASALLQAAEDHAPRRYIREKRPNHVTIRVRRQNVHIRDQRPISEKLLANCLLGGLVLGDYYELLNDRVFFWPTLQRLRRHYDRYEPEGPTILRFRTEDLLALNHVELSRLNSGATRANSYLGGVAPPRGRETFRSPDNYEHGISSIAEVTVEGYCTLPDNFEQAPSPDGPWTEIRRGL
jgi:hypothetical protein